MPRNQIGPLIAPPGTDPRSDETRMNKSTYETVRTKGLYSVEGLEAAAAKAKAENSRLLVNFEAASKEVKARWIRLRQCDTNPDCAEKARYHWRTVQTAAGATQVYGLITLHIITKDLPNWFWTDFGHIDCEKPEGECAHVLVGAVPATTPLVDPTTRATGGVRPGNERHQVAVLPAAWRADRFRHQHRRPDDPFQSGDRGALPELVLYFVPFECNGRYPCAGEPGRYRVCRCSQA